MSHSVRRAALGVARDPWDDAPRLIIPQFNAVPLTKDPLRPPCIENAREGVVRLEKGDFVVLQLQFRVGDDKTIAKDWQALDTLESTALPWSPWDGVLAPASLDRALPTVESAPAISFGPMGGRSLRAPFDHDAIHRYFADFIEHGQDACMRSRLCAGHADLADKINDSVLTMGDKLLKRIADDGGMHLLLERLRECGRHDIVAKFQ
ncbi:uncharacterized protein TRAVEDRAFT_54535 [Trametes versicolor FP-101664 SS1]|uniref:Uncharacterized protein n=1 Tax=Trametes versicolor (strain FP-101664) TaxID=717944 RepID=R7S957_TRAVS|nr:uncharacterized protein TRAVEDRAFT_54535 [Trametes versicolor FP-101664 SS1]EIW51499.1 hypothetical protein TRAVEDRAFT_54535 [Trametes versicolor FP-101664 SS1]